MIVVTKCKGEGMGSCRSCINNGIWNRMWMYELYHISKYEGCYCSKCCKDILSKLKGDVFMKRLGNGCIQFESKNEISVLIDEICKIVNDIEDDYRRDIIEDFLGNLNVMELNW